MVVSRYWRTGRIFYKYWKGWFLLGFIPLYIKQIEEK